MAKSNHQKSYQDMSEELQGILAELQTGELDIEQAIKRYERGMELADEMERYLKEAELKITQLKAKFDDKPAE